MLSERRFGVEIECGNAQGIDFVRAQLQKDGIKPLFVGVDGSGVEVRSPILKGKKGLEWLNECMQALREMKCYVSTKDGMHVHHEGIPDYRKRSLDAVAGPANVVNTLPCVRLVKSWMNNEGHIEKFVAARRRGGKYVCQKVWDSNTVDQLEKHGQTGIGGRLAALNLYNLKGTKGTIEIRLHEGTLDFEEAESWVCFSQALVDKASASKEPLPAAKDHKELVALLLAEQDERLRTCLIAKAERKASPAKNSNFKAGGNRPWLLGGQNNPDR